MKVSIYQKKNNSGTLFASSLRAHNCATLEEEVLVFILTQACLYLKCGISINLLTCMLDLT